MYITCWNELMCILPYVSEIHVHVEEPSLIRHPLKQGIVFIVISAEFCFCYYHD